MPGYFGNLQNGTSLVEALGEHLYKSQKRHQVNEQDDLLLLERYAGAIKGYYVVIIILSIIIALMTIAWFYFLYYLKKRLTSLRINDVAGNYKPPHCILQ